jgi:hypothetical protein
MLVRAHDQIVAGRDRATRIMEKAQRQLGPVRKQRQKAVGELRAAKRALAQAEKVKGPKRRAQAVKAAREQVRKAQGQLAPWTHRRDALVGIVKGAKSHRSTLNQARGTVLTDLDGVQGASGPVKQMTSLPAPGVLGGQIFQTQMSLRDLQARTDAPGGTTGAGQDDERTRLLEDLLRQANQRTAVSQSQYGILRDFQLPGFAGMFAKGGVIPKGMWGIAGETGRPEIVSGPATVYSPDQSAAMMAGGGETVIRVVLEDNRTVIYEDDRRVEEIVDRRVDRLARSGGRRLPGGAQL